MSSNPKSFRDIELISAYLDGNLSQVDKSRLEIRLKKELELQALFIDLETTRSLLRKLPARRAPRNFMLNPKMAGIKPPVPRAYPIFRFASVLATLIFVFMFTANISVPVWAAIVATEAAPFSGMGGGVQANSPELPASAPMQLDSAPAGTATPEIAMMLAAPTDVPADAAPGSDLRTVPGPMAKMLPETVEVPAAAEQQPVQLPIPASLQFGALGFAVICAAGAFGLRWNFEKKWFITRSVKPAGIGKKQAVIIILLLILVVLFSGFIYWISNITFYAPFAQNINLSTEYVGGDKGGPVDSTAQMFSLSPGMGYNFTAVDGANQITAIDFPPDIVSADLNISYIPGLNTTPPDVPYLVYHAFTLLPENKNIEPLSTYTITIDYSVDGAVAMDENNIDLYFWTGADWQDVSVFCNTPGSYNRQPEVHRFSVTACKFGTFIMVTP